MTADSDRFRLDVTYGDGLGPLVARAARLRERDFVTDVADYLDDDSPDVCILYGLRRTGKTVGIMQAIASSGPERMAQSAYLNVLGPGACIDDLYHDLAILEREGVRRFFVDEATALERYPDGSKALADRFAQRGQRVVLAGTDSLAFRFSQADALYDRALDIHTTAIPFGEFARVTGETDVDAYIERGGTMRREDARHSSPFSDAHAARRYMDSAIAGNILHALEEFRDGERLLPLLELHEAGSLRGVVSRIVQDSTHRFAVKAVMRAFKSADLGRAKGNLAARNPALYEALAAACAAEYDVVGKLARTLGIPEGDGPAPAVTQQQLDYLKSYLELLDVAMPYDAARILPDGSAVRAAAELMTQPGMRYSIAKELVDILMDSAVGPVARLARGEREELEHAVLDDVRGHILEEVVLRDTISFAREGETVAKVSGSYRAGSRQTRDYEFDMVVSRPGGTCDLYEVKHSAAMAERQAAHLSDERAVRAVGRHFGAPGARTVLYRGPASESWGVVYENVAGYLEGVYHRTRFGSGGGSAARAADARASRHPAPTPEGDRVEAIACAGTGNRAAAPPAKAALETQGRGSR